MPPEIQSAGATPVAEGATPSQNQPAQPAATTPAAPQTEPATGTDEALGEPGKKALSDERAAKKAAERERDALKARVEELENASKSDTDKAIAAARKEGEQAAETRWAALIRSARVEAALTAAGAVDAAIASQAREFAQLKVTPESGEVEGLGEAIEAFKTAHPGLFGTQQPALPKGDFGNGRRSSLPANKPETLEEAVAAQMGG